MTESSASSTPVYNGDHCPECGAWIVGGFEGCQSLLHEAGFLATSNLGFARVHRLLVDTFCMQHVEPYGHSAKSYAAHLTGLCCGLEFAGDPVLYTAIQRWLNGKTELLKPEVLMNRGEMTLADVWTMKKTDDKIRNVVKWANSVWSAYTPQHDLAHTWIDQIKGQAPKR